MVSQQDEQCREHGCARHSCDESHKAPQASPRSNREDPAFLFELQLKLYPPLSQQDQRGKLCRIFAFDANHTDPKTGHMRIDVEVWHGKACIFARGDTYCAVNRWTAIDSDAAKELVLSLVAMKPGDTDQDYFEGYTPAQLEFATAHGEEITMVRCDRFGES